jgi:ElaB/YqjD/DUF883 family membrane-anchored ribosome-binding protein
MTEMERTGQGVQLRDDAGGIAETVQEQASQAKEKGAEQLRAQLDERTTQVGESARTLADALRRSGNDVKHRTGAGDASTRLVSGLADWLDQAGNYLMGARGDDLLRDAEQFARRRPWLVAGTAAVAGFVASRFLKASSERRYGRTSTTDSRQTWEPRQDDGLSSPRYASPPTVTVGMGTEAARQEGS